LAIGYFNSNGQPVWFPASAYGLNYGVTIGSFLEAKNCKNIFIENIAVDGNNTPTLDGGKTMYNGGWVSDLIQRGATGAYFLNTKNVTLNKLNIHHMTLDGILFQDFYKDTLLYPKQAFSNLLITDTKCDYNRRQGFSWVGGRKVNVFMMIYLMHLKIVFMLRHNLNIGNQLWKMNMALIIRMVAYIKYI
jgi:hypothetical protein